MDREMSSILEYVMKNLKCVRIKGGNLLTKGCKQTATLKKLNFNIISKAC